MRMYPSCLSLLYSVKSNTPDEPRATFEKTASRRDVFHSAISSVCGALCGWILEPKVATPTKPSSWSARAAYVTDPHEPPTVPTADNIPCFVQGTVTLPADFDMEEILQTKMSNNKDDPLFPGSRVTPVPALYITVRPDRPDNVPKAILEGTRGKPPPVLSARFEQPTFPFAFHLTDKDFTLEGMPIATPTKENDESSNDNDNRPASADPWWIKDDLIVSARLDMDGIAATRSPEDLVGRAVYQHKKGGEAVELALMGRGAFGKFATGGGGGKKT